MKPAPTKRPEHVKVANLVYKIRWVDRAIGSGANKYGWCDHLRNTIFVDEDSPPLEVVDTLIHELLHVCWRATALPEEAKEESVCGRLSSSLLAAWMDNPDLFAWVNEQLMEGRI